MNLSTIYNTVIKVNISRSDRKLISNAQNILITRIKVSGFILIASIKRFKHQQYRMYLNVYKI